MNRKGALILAAGSSTRLGTPKQLVKIGNETLLERTVRVATEAGCSPIVIVLGSSAELVRTTCNLSGTKLVLNRNWSEGMASSIRAGVAELREVEGVVIMTCDMPAVTPSHILALAAAEGIAATSYAGRRGVPAFLPKSMFPLLMELQGDAGARELLGNTPVVELPGAELDIDTAEDLRLARARFSLGC